MAVLGRERETLPYRVINQKLDSSQVKDQSRKPTTGRHGTSLVVHVRVKNLPCNAEAAGSILGLDARIPHASEQLSTGATSTEAQMLWRPATQLESTHCNKDLCMHDTRISHMP